MLVQLHIPAENCQFKQNSKIIFLLMPSSTAEKMSSSVELKMSEFTNDSFSVETSGRESGGAASTDSADLMCTPHSTHWTTNFKLEGQSFQYKVSHGSTPAFQESSLLTCILLF